MLRAPATAPCDRRRLIVCTTLAALVFASRAWLAQVWGSALPFWDEWDLEAVGLYRPWMDGTLRLGDLFQAHNEHRLLLTRLVDLGFFVLYGRWAPWAQIVLNAALHAATAATLAALFWPALTARPRTGFIIGIAVIFSAICGWQNALLGIQSQVYFSNLLAVGALAGLTLAPPLSRGWWAGWVAALLALFSFAAGVFAALAALAVTFVFPPGGRRTLGHWAALTLIAALAAFSLFGFTEPPGQVAFHAQNLSQYYAVVSRCLGWPHVNSPVAWLLMQLPLVALLASRCRTRTTLNALDRCALALVMFAVLQAAAVAHQRGNGLMDSRPLSRYQDPLLLGAAAQLYAALQLAISWGRAGRTVTLAWSASAAFGLLTLTTTNLTLNLPYKRAQDIASLAQVRTYLITQDSTLFTRDPVFPGPHPNPKVVQQVLDDPVLRPVLPLAFFNDHSGSHGEPPPWIIAHGRTLFLVALAAFFAALVWPPPPSAPAFTRALTPTAPRATVAPSAAPVATTAATPRASAYPPAPPAPIPDSDAAPATAAGPQTPPRPRSAETPPPAAPAPRGPASAAK